MTKPIENGGGRKNDRRENDIEMALVAQDIRYMKDDIHEIKGSMQRGYVTKEEFEPIRKLVYGLVGLILVAVVAALLTLVVQARP